jgi:hypothetical protein
MVLITRDTRCSVLGDEGLGGTSRTREQHRVIGAVEATFKSRRSLCQAPADPLVLSHTLVNTSGCNQFWGSHDYRG